MNTYKCLVKLEVTKTIKKTVKYLYGFNGIIMIRIN